MNHLQAARRGIPPLCPLVHLVKVKSLGRKALVAGTVFENLGPLGLWARFARGQNAEVGLAMPILAYLIREKEGIFTEIHAFLPPRGMKRVHLSLSPPPLSLSSL